MANFNLFLPLLLKFEGGFTDNPNDPGGATNKGITLATFIRNAPAILGEAATLDNLKALTDEQAGRIYKPLYWDMINGDGINDQDTAEMITDFTVNSGTNHAVVTAQHLLINMGFSQVSADGLSGPVTLSAINSADTAAFYNGYKQARIAYYTTLVQHNPRLAGFLQGWLNRVNAFPDK